MIMISENRKKSPEGDLDGFSQINSLTAHRLKGGMDDDSLGQEEQDEHDDEDTEDNKS